MSLVPEEAIADVIALAEFDGRNEVWQCTPELRWRLNWVEKRFLEQFWVSDQGSQEWRRVPVFLD